MAVEVKHKFVSQKADGADDSLVKPSDWNDTHEIALSGPALIGRVGGGQGPAAEILLGTGLSFSGTTLNGAEPSAEGTTSEIAMFARSSPPAGWLKANGAAVSRTTYAALFAAIGTTFGAGNGSTTFNLPDLRGEFVRGWADGRGVDSGRTFGSAQGDQNKSHSHTGSTGSAGAHGHTASTNSTGAHTHTVAGLPTGSRTYQSNPEGGSGYPGTVTTSSAGNHSHTVTVASGGAHTHSVTINSNGGNEARPRNVALLYCIKY